MVAIRVAEIANRPEVRARFESLTSKEFDAKRLDLLRDLAHAAWYVRAESMRQEAISSARSCRSAI